MIEYCATKLLRIFKSYYKQDFDEELYQHGLEIIVSETISNSCVIIVSLMFDHLLCALLYILLFGTIRQYSGGYHAKNYFTCFLTYQALFLLYLLMDIYLYPHIIWLNIAVSLISISVIYCTAPVQHVNHPLTVKEKHINRQNTRICLAVYTFLDIMLLFLNTQLADTVMTVLFYIAVLSLILLLSPQEHLTV